MFIKAILAPIWGEKNLYLVSPQQCFHMGDGRGSSLLIFNIYIFFIVIFTFSFQTFLQILIIKLIFLKFYIFEIVNVKRVVQFIFPKVNTKILKVYIFCLNLFFF